MQSSPDLTERPLVPWTALRDGVESLDLDYITPTILACGGLWNRRSERAARRTNVRDAAEFMKTRHRDHFMVYILNPFDAGPKYDYRHFDHQVVEFHIDANNPSLDDCFMLCHGIDAWLNLSALNVALIHCDRGEHRTGLCISSYLLYNGICSNPFDAVDLFSRRRHFACQDRSHCLSEVLGPTYRRTLQHVHETLALRGIFPNNDSIFIQNIIIKMDPINHSNCTNYESKGSNNVIEKWESMELKIFEGPVVRFSSESAYTRDRNPLVFASEVCFDVKVTVRGSFALKLFCNGRRLFHIGLHTGFLMPGILRFGRGEIDISQSRHGDRIVSVDAVLSQVVKTTDTLDLFQTISTIQYAAKYSSLLTFRNKLTILQSHHVVTPSKEQYNLLTEQFESDLALFSLQRANNEILAAYRWCCKEFNSSIWSGARYSLTNIPVPMVISHRTMHAKPAPLQDLLNANTDAASQDGACSGLMYNNLTHLAQDYSQPIEVTPVSSISAVNVQRLSDAPLTDSVDNAMQTHAESLETRIQTQVVAFYPGVTEGNLLVPQLDKHVGMSCDSYGGYAHPISPDHDPQHKIDLNHNQQDTIDRGQDLSHSTNQGHDPQHEIKPGHDLQHGINQDHNPQNDIDPGHDPRHAIDLDQTPRHDIDLDHNPQRIITLDHNPRHDIDSGHDPQHGIDLDHNLQSDIDPGHDPQHVIDPGHGPRDDMNEGHNPQHVIDLDHNPQHDIDPGHDPLHGIDLDHNPQHVIDPGHDPQHDINQGHHPRHDIDTGHTPQHYIDVDHNLQHDINPGHGPRDDMDKCHNPQHVIDLHHNPQHDIDPGHDPRDDMDKGHNPQHVIDLDHNPQHDIDPGHDPLHVIDLDHDQQHDINPGHDQQQVIDPGHDSQHVIDPDHNPQHDINPDHDPRHGIVPGHDSQHVIDLDYNPQHDINPGHNPRHDLPAKILSSPVPLPIPMSSKCGTSSFSSPTLPSSSPPPSSALPISSKPPPLLLQCPPPPPPPPPHAVML